MIKIKTRTAAIKPTELSIIKIKIKKKMSNNESMMRNKPAIQRGFFGFDSS